MPSISLFSDLLEISKQEQHPVNIFITNAVLTGIVTSVQTGIVEIRTTENKRCYIATEKIEAITTL
jgi:sRNA-binding regulator protein Hfq